MDERQAVPIRLTRRGRMVVVVALFLALVGGGLGMAASASQAAAPERTAPVVVVQPGETLWSIAVRHDPDGDPYETIEEIRRLNRIDGYTVHPGQRLRLPS